MYTGYTSHILWCPCGTPHEVGEWLWKVIEERGRDVVAVDPKHNSRGWEVPRVFVASHGFDINEVARLAERYNFTQVDIKPIRPEDRPKSNPPYRRKDKEPRASTEETGPVALSEKEVRDDRYRTRGKYAIRGPGGGETGG